MRGCYLDKAKGQSPIFYFLEKGNVCISSCITSLPSSLLSPSHSFFYSLSSAFSALYKHFKACFSFTGQVCSAARAGWSYQLKVLNTHQMAEALVAQSTGGGRELTALRSYEEMLFTLPHACVNICRVTDKQLLVLIAWTKQTVTFWSHLLSPPHGVWKASTNAVRSRHSVVLGWVHTAWYTDRWSRWDGCWLTVLLAVQCQARRVTWHCSAGLLHAPCPGKPDYLFPCYCSSTGPSLLLTIKVQNWGYQGFTSQDTWQREAVL